MRVFKLFTRTVKYVITLQVSQPTRIQRKCDSQGDVLVFYNKADQQAFMTLWFFLIIARPHCFGQLEAVVLWPNVREANWEELGHRGLGKIVAGKVLDLP